MRLGHRAVTRALAATFASLVLAAAAGCGGESETNIESADDKPKRSEGQARDDEPSPTPTFQLEEEPYVQVALDYYEAFNKANDTGEVEKLRELSTADCKACRLTADRLEKVYADGGHIEGGDLEQLPDVDIAVEGSPDRGTAYVTVVYEYLEETVVEKAGAKPKDFPTELTEEQFTLEKVEGTWKISDLTSEEYED